MEILKAIGIQAAAIVLALVVIFFLLKLSAKRQGGCGCGCGGACGGNKTTTDNPVNDTVPYELSF